MKVDEARCFQCQQMFEPWTNELYCCDACAGAANRAAQAKALIERHRQLRANQPARTDDPGVGDGLLDEMAALAPLRAEVNAKYLD